MSKNNMQKTDGKKLLQCIFDINGGDFEKMFADIKNKKVLNPSDIESVDKSYHDKDIDFLAIIDENYPTYMKKAFKPSMVIATKGNKNIMKENGRYVYFQFTTEKDVDEIIDKATFRNCIPVFAMPKGKREATHKLSLYLNKIACDHIILCSYSLTLVGIAPIHSLYLSLETLGQVESNEVAFSKRQKLACDLCEKMVQAGGLTDRARELIASFNGLKKEVEVL